MSKNNERFITEYMLKIIDCEPSTVTFLVNNGIIPCSLGELVHVKCDGVSSFLPSLLVSDFTEDGDLAVYRDVSGTTIEFSAMTPFMSQRATLTVSDPDVLLTRLYDDYGNWTVQHVTMDGYGPVVQASREVDELGNITSLKEFGLKPMTTDGSVDGITITGTSETTFVYDDTGRLLIMKDANGSITYGYMGEQRAPSCVTNQLGESTCYLYDSSGNVLSIKKGYEKEVPFDLTYRDGDLILITVGGVIEYNASVFFRRQRQAFEEGLLTASPIPEPLPA